LSLVTTLVSWAWAFHSPLQNMGFQRMVLNSMLCKELRLASSLEGMRLSVFFVQVFACWQQLGSAAVLLHGWVNASIFQ